MLFICVFIYQITQSSKLLITLQMNPFKPVCSCDCSSSDMLNMMFKRHRSDGVRLRLENVALKSERQK